MCTAHPKHLYYIHTRPNGAIRYVGSPVRGFPQGWLYVDEIPKSWRGENAVNASHETGFFFFFYLVKKCIPVSADKIKSHLAAVSREKRRVVKVVQTPLSFRKGPWCPRSELGSYSRYLPQQKGSVLITYLHLVQPVRRAVTAFFFFSFSF